MWGVAGSGAQTLAVSRTRCCRTDRCTDIGSNKSEHSGTFEAHQTECSEEHQQHNIPDGIGSRLGEVSVADAARVHRRAVVNRPNLETVSPPTLQLGKVAALANARRWLARVETTNPNTVALAFSGPTLTGLGVFAYIVVSIATLKRV